MSDHTVRVRLEANIAGYQAAMALAAADTKRLGRELSGAGKTGKADLQQLGTGAMIMGGGMLAGFGLAAGAAMNFDAQLSELGAVSGATGHELDLLRQQALDAGAATVFSASQAAEAQAELAKAGVSTADILGGGLDGALNLAAAGQLDLAKASELTANAMTAFGLSGKDVPRIADTLAAGANKSAASVESMGMSLQQTALVADQLGIPLEETVGGLAMFAQAGLKGSDAGTSMKTMLQRFNPVSKEAATLMEELGIDFFDAQGNFVGLEQAAGELQAGMANLTQEQRAAALQTIFGQDAIRAATVLYEGGATGVAEWTGKVTDSGYAAELAAKKTDNLKGDLEQLRGSIETTLIEGGTQANGVLRFLTQGTTDLVNGIGSMPGPLAATAMGFTAVVGTGLTAIGVVGTMAPKYREVMTALTKMGPAGLQAATAIQTVGKAAVAGGIAVAGLTVAWSMWNAELEESRRASRDVLGGIETSGVGQATRQIEEIKRQVAGLDQDLANSSEWAFWDEDKRQGLTEFRNGLVVLGDQMQTMVGQADALAAATGGNADSIYTWLDGQRQAGTVFESNEAALQAYQAALATGAVSLTEVSDETKAAERASIDFKAALDGLLDSLFGMEDARDALQRGLNDLPDVLSKVQGDFQGTSEAALEYRDHMRGMADDAAALIEQTAEQIGQGPELEAAIRYQIAALVDEAVARGVSREEAERYFGQLLTIQGIGAITTDVNVNTANALVNIANLMGGIDGLMAKLATLDGRANAAGLGGSIAAGITRLQGRAGGGFVGANTVTPVNERGIEMLTVSGTDYLLTGGVGGQVTPHSQTMAAIGAGSSHSGGGGVVVQKLVVSAPNYLGDPRQLVDALKWPLIDAMRDVHNARAGRDN